MRRPQFMWQGCIVAMVKSNLPIRGRRGDLSFEGSLLNWPMFGDIYSGRKLWSLVEQWIDKISQLLARSLNKITLLKKWSMNGSINGFDHRERRRRIGNVLTVWVHWLTIVCSNRYPKHGWTFHTVETCFFPLTKLTNQRCSAIWHYRP